MPRYQHIVLFSFPNELSDADWDEFQARVRSFATEIGGMETLRLGRPSSDSHANGYQYLMLIEFADEEKLDYYTNHPVHQDFGGWIIGLGCQPILFRYELDDETVIV